MIFKPDQNKIIAIDGYVDADFGRNYAKETNHYLNSRKSRTGCVIKFGNCPITWFSRVQTEIALSTTNAECIASYTAARERLPMRELTVEITVESLTILLRQQ